MAKLYMMRHGETLFNKLGRKQGWSDSPLTETGIQEARITGAWLRAHGIVFDHAYSSTSERACDTLELAAPGMPYERVKGLKEWNFGVFEGLPEEASPRPNRGEFYVPFGGEAEDAFIERIYSTVLALMRRPGHERVLVVSHGSAVARFPLAWGFHLREYIVEAGKASSKGSSSFGNCAFAVYDFDGERFAFEDIVDPNALAAAGLFDVDAALASTSGAFAAPGADSAASFTCSREEKPAEPVEPLESAEPMEPAKLAEPMGSLEPMERIASFGVNHLVLEPGIYVSRVDRDPATGATATTFDLRLTAPNREPVLNTAECHTIEHLGATFLRNHPVWGPRIVYFGPMGCRTGFYLVVWGELTSAEVLPVVRETFEFVRDFEGEVPGARPEECGNYLDQNLNMARWVARRYLERDLAHIDAAHLRYPDMA